jgi:hypothetical protein
VRDPDRGAAVRRRRQVSDAERDELPAARQEVARDEQQRTVATVDQTRVERCEDRAHRPLRQARGLPLPTLRRLGGAAHGRAVGRAHLLVSSRTRDAQNAVHPRE